MRRPSRFPVKRALQAGAALVLAGLIVYAMVPEPVEVEAGRVVRGPLAVTVDEEGRTRVRQRYVVSAPVTGRLHRLALEQGDVVSAGDVVARITPAPLDAREQERAEARARAAEAEADAARAALGHARAAAEQAARELERVQRLAEAGALARQELEHAALAARTREAELAAAEKRAAAAALYAEEARAALLGVTSAAAGEHVTVRAPVSGTVLRLGERSERVVAAGTPLLELGDPTDLEVVIDVLSTQAVEIEVGAPVLIRDWGGDGVLHARVCRVAPAAFTETSALGIQEQRVSVIAEFAEPPPARLGDDYRVEAQIVVWQRADAVKVPTSALFRRAGEDGWAVFVIEGGRARLRPITLGRRAALEAEVLAGLEPGEVVVLYPDDRLEDGTRVRPVVRGGAATGG